MPRAATSASFDGSARQEETRKGPTATPKQPHRTKRCQVPPPHTPSFWSRFFCNGAELERPVLSSPSSDSDVEDRVDPQPTSPTTPACEAMSRLVAVINSGASPFTTDSSSEDSASREVSRLSSVGGSGRYDRPGAVECEGRTTLRSRTALGASSTQPSPRHSGSRFPGSYTSGGGSGYAVAQSRTMSRERLYEWIRAVRVPRAARRGGGSGSFSPQKVALAVKSDQRVLSVPALPAILAVTSGAEIAATEVRTTGSARSCDSTSDPLVCVAAPADLPDDAPMREAVEPIGEQPPPVSDAGTRAEPSPSRRVSPAFVVKDTRFFPQPQSDAGCTIAELPAAGLRGDDEVVDLDAERRLAQALTEKRLQRHQQKLVEEKRRRDELLALRELERQQRTLTATRTAGASSSTTSALPSAAVLTEKVLEAHKRGNAFPDARNRRRSSADRCAGAGGRDKRDATLRLDDPTFDSHSPRDLPPTAERMRSSVFEDDKTPGIVGASPPQHCVDPALEGVAQCAVPPTGAGVARRVRSLSGRVKTNSPASRDPDEALVSSGARAVCKYPLNSRAYVERVVLADRRQQALALLFLLDETRRFAWEWHLKLLQFYHYYFHPILTAVTDADTRERLQHALLRCGTGSVAKVHVLFYRDGLPVDYQQYKYEFDEAWRKLFHAVRAYLNMPHRCTLDSVSTAGDVELDSNASSTDDGQGTVGFAATLLHSMELFQRQQEVQNASHESHEWTLWFYYVYLPAVQSGNPPPMPASTVNVTEQDGARRDSGRARSDDDRHTSSPPQPDVLPMEWAKAQDATLRSAIYWARRQAKLNVIKRAEKKLRRAQRERRAPGGSTTDTAERKRETTEAGDVDSSSATNSASSSASSDSSSASSETSSPHSSAPSPQDAFIESAAPSSLPLDGERGDETLQLRVLTSSTITPDTRLSSAGPGDATAHPRHPHASSSAVTADLTAVSAESNPDVLEDYRVVNVGCFGFSFWSRADW